MISAFKKIWDFAGSEQKNIKRSIVLALLHSIFYALQFAAVFVILKALTGEDKSKINALYALGIMAASITGRIILNTYSQLQRVHAGYFMVANKRISIGSKLRTVPMGYFNKNNLGQMTAITTTTLTDVENTAPVVLVTVLGGFINSVVFALSCCCLIGVSVSSYLSVWRRLYGQHLCRRNIHARVLPKDSVHRKLLLKKSLKLCRVSALSRVFISAKALRVR